MFKGWRGCRASVLRGAAVLVLAGTVPAAAGAQQQLPKATTSLVFEGVTVVDVEQGKLLPAQRVVITGNRIQAVGNVTAVKMPMGAQVVDARGRYLIPGLWDMHTHTFAQSEDDAGRVLDCYAAFLLVGVTGVRDMDLGRRNTRWLTSHPDPEDVEDDVGTAIAPDALRRWRQEVAAGIRKGPRVLGGARLREIGLPPSPAQVRHGVDSIKALGADFIKVHSFGEAPHDAYMALLGEARRVGLTVAGHLPFTVSLAEASDSGLRSVEHFFYFSGPCWRSDSAADAECRALAARLVRNGTWLTPTLHIRSRDSTAFATPRWYVDHVPDTVRTDTVLHLREASSDADGLWFVHRAQRVAHFPWLAGSDVQLPGDGVFNVSEVWGIHDELARFVKAGLTPVEALRTATLNPAQYWQAADTLGTVAAGKVADLVLLDADPLADITNTKTIRAVVANGRYFDRTALDQLLAEAESRAQANQEPEP